MSVLDQFFGPNAGYAAELLERYQQDPASLDPAVRAEVAQWHPLLTEPTGPEALLTEVPAIPEAVQDFTAKAARAAELAQGIRYYGHRAARLDPLGLGEPEGDPQLDLESYGLTEVDLEQLPGDVVGGEIGREASTATEGIRRLRAVYCGTSGYQFRHIQVPAERAWLLAAIEGGQYCPPRDPLDERALLNRLTELSAFERFLHRAYPGATRFSIEGLGIMIPMLDELIDRAAESGVRTILLGMAHRGRLNVLAHILGKPYAQIVAEFEGYGHTRRMAPSESSDEGWTGDVKYHAGGRRAYQQSGAEPGTVSIVMAPNPSHLEFVNPVVEGMARAGDDDRGRGGPARRDEVVSLAVLIHGDAAFPGQGVVAETLNLSRLPGYSTGGTIHLIANNQLGFTTDPSSARSTLYASDLAKGFEIPVIHVNADDPAACLAAMRLAVGYRTTFHKDVLIDLVGYRRWGHNEGDEPAFTQPRVYAAVAKHPTVRERFSADLVGRGVLAEGEPEALLRAGLDRFQRIREEVLAAGKDQGDGAAAIEEALTPPHAEGTSAHAAADGRQNGRGGDMEPPVSLEDLRAINEALLRFPTGFTVHPKLERPLQRRRAALEDAAQGRVDWGHAETLAFATLVREGIPIRLTGQDAVRGTFSQRHAAFFDAQTGAAFMPVASLASARASFDVWNSPLSENACVGFEYGYSIHAPEALVLWEAQYGDFVNGAQVMIDEFVVSGEAKWGLRSGLVLLLPHAWEGQGPDHSSGRLERFLELAAEGNIRVANCTTAAQYFHLLRRQAHTLRSDPRPLVLMTPKSLLRHPLAASAPRDLAEGHFQPVLDDLRTVATPERARRLVLCSGKVWADIESARASRGDGDDLAVARIEELYPFPDEEVARIVDRYTGAREVVWLQEEPRNMGAWTFVTERLRGHLRREQTLRYIGRPERASPAEGWSDVHAVEQQRIVQEVLEMEVASHGR